MNRAGPDGTEVVDLRPGEGWSSTEGFRRSADRPSEDWCARAPVIQDRVREVTPTLEAQAIDEAEVSCSFEEFHDYFDELVRAVPRPARRLAGGRPVAFAAPWSEPAHWVVDLASQRVWAAAEPPVEAASVVAFDQALLGEGIRNRILHFAQGSFRQRTHVRAGGIGDDLALWALVMIFEIGYLPLRSSVRPRVVGVAIRRWREGVDTLAALVAARRGSPLERLAGGFGALEGPGRRR